MKTPDQELEAVIRQVIPGASPAFVSKSLRDAKAGAARMSKDIDNLLDQIEAETGRRPTVMGPKR